jgi:hypothetical protein
MLSAQCKQQQRIQSDIVGYIHLLKLLCSYHKRTARRVATPKRAQSTESSAFMNDKKDDGDKKEKDEEEQEQEDYDEDEDDDDEHRCTEATFKNLCLSLRDMIDERQSVAQDRYISLLGYHAQKQNQLQKDHAQPFWGRILPNESGHILLRPYCHTDDILEVAPEDCAKAPCGSWLFLRPPLVMVGKASEKVFIETLVVESSTAYISSYWVEVYRMDDEMHVLGDFRFSIPCEHMSLRTLSLA